jgi:hypothetical protein
MELEVCERTAKRTVLLSCRTYATKERIENGKRLWVIWGRMIKFEFKIFKIQFRITGIH